MKMKLIDRILTGLYALLLTLMLVVVGFCALDPTQAHRVAGLFAVCLNSVWVQAAMVVVVLVLIAGLFRLIARPFLRERASTDSSVSVQNAESGTVLVSVSALDTLVRRAIGNTEGVLEYATRIVNNEDSVTVEIDMAVTADTHITNVTMLMQRSIKLAIEEYSGIAVREVVVLVKEIRDTAVPTLPAPAEETPVVEAEVAVEAEEIAEAEATIVAEGAAQAEAVAEAEEAAQAEPVIEAEDAVAEAEGAAQAEAVAEADASEETDEAAEAPAANEAAAAEEE